MNNEGEHLVSIPTSPEKITKNQWMDIIKKDLHYINNVTILSVSWTHTNNLNLIKKFSTPDINMPNTQIESVRNKVAELMAHGLNAREIQKSINLFTKPQLVRIIMDLIEHPVETN